MCALSLIQDVPRQNEDSSYKAVFLRYAKQVSYLKHLSEEKQNSHVDLHKKETLLCELDANPFREMGWRFGGRGGGGNVAASSNGHPESSID